MNPWFSKWRYLYWRPGQLARKSSALLAWMILRALAQVITLILLTRMLGAQVYGEFVAIAAVAGFAIPLVGIGLSHLVLRNGSRDPQHLPQYFTRAVWVWLHSIVPLAALTFAAAIYLLPSALPLWVIFATVFAELAAGSLTELVGRQRQAQGNINTYGAISAGLPIIRLCALILLSQFNTQVNLNTVLWTYVTASMGYFMILAKLAFTRLTAAQQNLPEAMSIASGMSFCTAAFAMRLQGEFNKPMLARIGADLAGSYNIAQRAVDIANLPLQALQEALWPRLYAQPNPMHQLRHTGLALLTLALVLGATLWFIAPLLRFIFGSAFSNAVEVLKMLAWLPVFQLGRSLLNFHAIHCGLMHKIAWAYLFGGTASVVLVIALTPNLGLMGAVIASYASEATMIATLLLPNYFKKLNNKE